MRIVAALIFLLHGASKFMGFPPSPMPMPPAMSMMWLGGVLELVGGLLLLFGPFSRVVAFVLSREMVVAYWMFHAPKSTFPSINGGDAAILYCFAFLAVAAIGSGRWSIDAALGRKCASVTPVPDLG